MVTTEVPEISPEQPSPINNNTKRVSIPFFVVILLLSLALAFLAYQNYQLKQQLASLNQSQISLPQPSPTSKPDPTAGWKKYQITHDSATGYPNYEIKLPTGWKQIEHSSNIQNSETFQDSNKEGSIQIDILENSSGSLNEFLIKFDNDNQTGWENQPSRKVINTRLTKLGTFNVVEREENWLAAGFTAKVVYFPTKNFVFSVAVYPYNAGGSPLTEALDYFDQIISTFKFTK